MTNKSRTGFDFFMSRVLSDTNTHNADDVQIIIAMATECIDQGRFYEAKRLLTALSDLIDKQRFIIELRTKPR